MKKYFRNKVIIITGASSGIGKSCVYQLAKDGARLVLVSRDIEKMHRIKRDLPDNDILIVPTDVSDREQVENMVLKVVKEYNRIDILINNAGVGIHGSIISTPLSAFQHILEVNLFGTLYTIRAVYPHMKETGGGSIVNVSSVAGLKGFYDSGLYSATKFAVTGLTESLAMEAEKDNIKTILICPGKTETDFEKNVAFDEERRLSKRSGVHPDLVAGVILKAIRKKKKMAVVGKGCKILYYLNRVSPALADHLIKVLY